MGISMACCNVESKAIQSSNKRNKVKCEKFAVKHFGRNAQNNFNTNQFDQRRIVFISLLGAYQTWKECPSFALYFSLFLVPLKQNWILYPEKYREELYTHFIHPLCSVSDKKGRDDFMELLRWKNTQNLVLWMLDEPQNESDSTHPFWYKLSHTINNLYDPITCRKYKPLHLDYEFWQTDDIQSTYCYKYDIEPCAILSELCCLNMKFKTMQAIIYQSNPKSLHPVKYYGDDGIRANAYEHRVSISDNEIEVWWISPDYDPNE